MPRWMQGYRDGLAVPARPLAPLGRAAPTNRLSLRIVRPEPARSRASALPRPAMATGGLLLGLAGSALFASRGAEIPASAIGLETPVAATFTAPVSPSFNPGDPMTIAPGSPDPNAPLTAGQRAAIQAAIAVPSYVGPAPAGTAIRFATNADRERALGCMTQAIYYEAGTEPEAGQRAVAQVVINRMRHPDYPNSVCGVVYQTCQFTFTCDGALARRPVPAIWSRARRYAEDALAGRAFAGVGYSTHYHTVDIWPYWADVLPVTTTIARHIFHRMPGAGGAPYAFSARHAGREPAPRPFTGVIRSAAATRVDAELAAIVAAQAQATADNLPPAPAIRAGAAPPESQPAGPDDHLPQSQIRPEFRDSGRWIGG